MTTIAPSGSGTLAGIRLFASFRSIFSTAQMTDMQQSITEPGILSLASRVGLSRLVAKSNPRVEITETRRRSRIRPQNRRGSACA